MLSSIFLNGALGFAMLLALLFCMGDIVQETQSATNFPFMDVYTYAVGSVNGGTALVSDPVREDSIFPSHFPPQSFVEPLDIMKLTSNRPLSSFPSTYSLREVSSQPRRACCGPFHEKMVSHSRNMFPRYFHPGKCSYLARCKRLTQIFAGPSRDSSPFVRHLRHSYPEHARFPHPDRLQPSI